MPKIRVSKRRCMYHPQERAATCQECYDLALMQQRAQQTRQQQVEHAKYLKRLGYPLNEVLSTLE